VRRTYINFTCTRCKVEQPLDNFHKRSMVKRGHDSWCKECKSIYRKSYFENNREKETTRGRVKAWKTLGIDISLKEYNLRCALLNDECEICKKKNGTLNVDHCHTTGKIRGLLCGSCNRAIGLLKEDVSILQSAVNYLNKQ